MFFSSKIVSINESDRVLEIGPGATPHPRSDIFLDLRYEDENEEQAQFGYSGKLNSEKKIVYYDGEEFPFKDNEFDYIICSHVLEHVENLELFLSEIFRVAPKGYFEYPKIHYDYLFNIPVHLNFLKYDGKSLYYQKKSESPLHHFKEIQHDLWRGLNDAQFKVFNYNNEDLLFEGFEWHEPFDLIHTDQMKDLLNEIPFEYQNSLNDYITKHLSFKELSKILGEKLKRKIFRK